MIQLPINNFWHTAVNVIGPNDDLPIPSQIQNLYLDFETTSEQENVASINPHKNCKILGAAILFDNQAQPYYVPVRHAYLNEFDEYEYRTGEFANHSVEKVHRWLRAIFEKAEKWINHNIKYDWHVLFRETGIIPRCTLVDTLLLAKLSNFEEQFSYSLDNVMKLFQIDITEHEKEIKKFLGRKYKDYGLIPPDAMAVYAAVDVLAVRHLHHRLPKVTHEDVAYISEVEHELLPMLIQMETIGVKTDIYKIKEDYDTIIPKQIDRVRRILQISGMTEFEPGKKAHQYELFVNRLGLRNLLYTEKGELSFGWASLMRCHNEAPEIIDTYLEYVEDQKLIDGFCIPYLEQHIDGNFTMHPSFNQIVRTGRMSCTSPNMQQLSPRAKEYIVPYSEDHVLVEFDLSQIEFRVIVHYIENKRCLAAYRSDPNTDYHTWVAEECGIARKPAKTMNFLLGYGGGKEKAASELMQLPEIIEGLSSESAIKAKAYSVYDAYHAALPELRPNQNMATSALMRNGYVRTFFGRHRNLPRYIRVQNKLTGKWTSTKNNKGFNTVCQGTAADFQKIITVRLKKFISFDCILHLLVHDSWLFSIRKDLVEELVPQIKEEIEKDIPNFLVPIRSDYGISDKNWRLCDE